MVNGSMLLLLKLDTPQKSPYWYFMSDQLQSWSTWLEGLSLPNRQMGWGHQYSVIKVPVDIVLFPDINFQTGSLTLE